MIGAVPVIVALKLTWSPDMPPEGATAVASAAVPVGGFAPPPPQARRQPVADNAMMITVALTTFVKPCKINTA